MPIMIGSINMFMPPSLYLLSSLSYIDFRIYCISYYINTTKYFHYNILKLDCLVSTLLNLFKVKLARYFPYKGGSSF